jgi:predicted nucleotidyltransferase
MYFVYWFRELPSDGITSPQSPSNQWEKNEMETITKAIETMGLINILHHLVLDEPLPVAGLNRIRGIILMHKVSEIGKAEWLQVAAADSALNFLKARRHKMGDKKSISTIVKMLRLHDTDVREKFKITEIGVFGSYVRGEQREDSDIDILVEFENGYKTFDNYMELKFFLEDILTSEIDLVIKTAIRDEIKQNILSEVTYA